MALAKNRDAGFDLNQPIFWRWEVWPANAEEPSNGLQVSSPQEGAWRKSTQVGRSLRASHTLILNTEEDFCRRTARSNGCRFLNMSAATATTVSRHWFMDRKKGSARSVTARTWPLNSPPSRLPVKVARARCRRWVRAGRVAILLGRGLVPAATSTKPAPLHLTSAVQKQALRHPLVNCPHKRIGLKVRAGYPLPLR